MRMPAPLTSAPARCALTPTDSSAPAAAVPNFTVSISPAVPSEIAPMPAVTRVTAFLAALGMAL